LIRTCHLKQSNICCRTNQCNAVLIVIETYLFYMYLIIKHLVHTLDIHPHRFTLSHWVCKPVTWQASLVAYLLFTWSRNSLLGLGAKRSSLSLQNVSPLDPIWRHFSILYFL
jgi:hypothetical protein